MRTLKDDQFDRRKMEVRQRMESKRTNSPIDFYDQDEDELARSRSGSAFG